MKALTVQQPWASCIAAAATHRPDLDTGRKTLEIRWDDRDYRAGDLLVLREIVNDDCAWSYTGRVCQRQVTHVLQGDQFGLARGYVALSLAVTERGESMNDAQACAAREAQDRLAQLQADKLAAERAAAQSATPR